MATIKAVLRKKKNKEGKYPIALRITKNRQTSYIYIGKYVNFEEWDEVNQRVKKSHPNYIRLNNYIKKKLSLIDDKDLEMESQNKVVSAKALKKQMEDNGQKMTFFKLAHKYLTHLEQTEKYSRLNTEKSRIKHFREFSNGGELYFQEITELYLKNFQAYLKAKGLSDRSVVNNMIVIRTIFNLAIREDIVDRKYYPFGKGKITVKFPESAKIGLTIEEVKKIEALDLIIGSPIWHARNVWLFSFYIAGMRVSDVLEIKWSDFHDNRLHYTMGKNHKTGSLKIPDKAFAILKQYEKEKESKDDFVFPELKKAHPENRKDIYRKAQTATKKFNKYLGTIAKLAEIDKKITMHIARHTFGNVSGEKIPIQMLQKLYRHTSITTTIGYQSNFMYKDADDALEAVIN